MENWDAVLGDLRGEFVRDAQRKLDEALGHLEALRGNLADTGALTGLMRRFHGFSGSGTTYGFPRVTALGAQGELECSGLMRGGTLPSPADLERWTDVVSRLRAELESREPSAAPAVELPLPAPPSGFDVLIVDDDTQLVELLSRMIRDEGLSVRGATTRAAAMQAIGERVPDGMIVDLLLPDGSGYDVVRQVRALPHGETAVVLILSKMTGFLDKVEAIHCGADGYFEKPLEWDALMGRLLHLLRKAHPETFRVLSVEDDPAQASFLRMVLESAGYELRVCADPNRFDAELVSFRPDLVLMDIVLPGISGYDLVRYLRQDERYATLPVLFLTTEAQLDAKIQAARAGGDDYLLKPVSPALLLTAVAARIERSRFLKTLLERDGLTRLLTHTAFLERAQGVVARQRRAPGRSHAWVMIDVDNFKSVNDRHGHPMGDRVLKSLAALLRRRLRQSDVVGRYGGEEFAVLLEDLDEKDAVRLVSRLREEFAATEHPAADGTCFRASFSAGLAMLREDEAVAVWRLAADEALYAAKAAGRNTVVAAPATPRSNLLRHPGASPKRAGSFNGGRG